MNIYNNSKQMNFSEELADYSVKWISQSYLKGTDKVES